MAYNLISKILCIFLMQAETVIFFVSVPLFQFDNQFRYMTLPLLKGVFKTNITMWSVSSVGFFVWSQLFSTVTADTQTITPYVYMYMQIFGGGNTVTERNAGLGAAIGVLLSVCVVIVFTICNRVIKDDDLEF